MTLSEHCSNDNSAKDAVDNSVVEEEVTESKNAVLHKCGGFNLLSQRPIISRNNKLLFVVSDRIIRKYSLINGNFLDEFTFGNKCSIVSVQENPENVDEFIVVFEDGMLVYWNYVDNLKNTEAFLKLNADNNIVTLFQQVNNVYYFVVKMKRKKHNSCQLYYCLKNQLNNIMMIRQGDLVNDSNKSVTFHANGEYIASIHKHILYVYQIPVKINSLCRKYYVNLEKRLICVAFHPTDTIVATGDSLGQITIWNNVLTGDASKMCHLMHWHSQSVADIAFSPSGTSLYSVGAEMVLVKWNLVGQFLGEKNFLPRLGSPMKYVTVDKNHQIIVTSHEDQTLQIIDSQMNGVRTVIEGMCLGSGFEGKLSSGLHYNSRMSALSFNGNVGHVQFYSPLRQKQIFQLDVAQQNIISAVNVKNFKERLSECKSQLTTNKIYPIEVTQIAVSNDGHWLATVEFRDDHDTLPEIRLKFWFLKKESNFFLNTTIHLPHQDEITYITFSPLSEDNSLHLVTTSKDKTFKIWDLNVDNGKKWWNCSRDASLNSYSVPTMAAFSFDASLLTVLFGNIVTLWELDSATSIRYIPRMDIFKFANTSTIIFIGFGAGKYSHYLIEGTGLSVVVRNIIKKFEVAFVLKRAKTEPRIDSINFNRYENMLSICTVEGVKFLSLKSQNIVLKIDFTKNLSFRGKIIASTFTSEQPSTILFGFPLQKSTFYCMNEKQELYKAVVTTTEEVYNDDNAILVGSEINRKTELFLKHVGNNLGPLALMLNKNNNSDDNGKQSNSNNLETASSEKNRKMLVDKFFYNVPSHVLPPVSMFEKSFLSSYFECLHQTPVTSETKNSSSQQLSYDKRIQFNLESADLPPPASQSQNNNEPKNSTSSNFLNYFNIESNSCLNQDKDDADDNNALLVENEFSWLSKYFKSNNINSPEKV